MSMILHSKYAAITNIQCDRVLHLVTAIALIIFVSACATSGGSKGNRIAVKQNCSETQNKSGSVNQKDCLLDGVIEISENYGVEPKVREQFNEAVKLLNEGEHSAAIKLLKTVTSKTTKFSAPYINLGMAYAQLNEMDKAEESFKKALDINKQHPVALNELGLVYRKTGRFSLARETYESLLTTYPGFLPAKKNLGVLCDIYMQDLDCALEQFQGYLERVPENENVKIWVADVKSRMD